jgi:hypothetical protein
MCRSQEKDKQKQTQKIQMGRALQNFAIIAIILLSISTIVLTILTCCKPRGIPNAKMTVESLMQRQKSLVPIRLAMVTIETRSNLHELVALHNASMTKYCSIHDYRYTFMKSYVSHRPIYWQKLELVLSTLTNTDCAYCMWLDSDTAVQRLEYPINVVIDYAPTCSLWIGHDHHNVIGLCAGVFMVKNNSTGRSFVQRCIEIYDQRIECWQDGHGLAGKWAGRCYEQGVMNEVAIEPEYLDHVACVPPNFFQNGNPIQESSFIVHQYGPKRQSLQALRTIYPNITVLPYTRNQNPLRICVLLTTYAIPSRVKQYQKIIDAWEDTGVPLFVVDSSGCCGLRYKNYCCFDQGTIPDNLSGPSTLEKESILRAMDFFVFDEYDIVVKITGKYFMKDLVEQFNYIPTGTEIIIQANQTTCGQNSECFGATPAILLTLLQSIEGSFGFEDVALQAQSTYEAVRLPRHDISKTERVTRSDGSVLEYL